VRHRRVTCRRRRVRIAIPLGFLTLAAALALPVPALLGAQSSAQNATLNATQNTAWKPGDEFRPGDRILLRVEGEQQLTDTFTVREGPALELPAIGRISLVGVHREDIQPYLTREVGKYLKTPIVRARALIRIGLLGELTRPGYYNVPSDALVSDVLTAAGGPTKDSRMEKSRVDRAGATVVKSDSLRQAIAAGLTIGQIGMQSGDNVFVPRSTDPEHTWRVVAILVTIPAAIYAVMLLVK
jgi:polysaccharide export outer membrane protein